MRSICFLLFMFIGVQLSAQDSSVIKIYPFPPSTTPLFDFEDVENRFSLLPLSGGLFCPQSNSWYTLPEGRQYMSVSYLQQDSSVSYCIRCDKGSYILTNKVNRSMDKLRDSIWLPIPGFYFVKRLSRDTLVYGGLINGYYSVFQLINNKSVLLFSYKGRISNIQVQSANAFFFQAGNRIFYFEKGYKPYCIYSSQYNLDGFGFDPKMNLYISRKEGIFRMKKRSISLVLPYIHGPLKINNGYLYVLSLQESEFIQLRL